MKRRLVEFIFVLSVAALVIQFTTKEEEVSVEPKPQAAAQSTKTLAVGDLVPGFELTDASGEVVTFQQGDGPIFVTLTATGCGDCVRRINEEDVTAFEMAKKSELKVWNMLVYHPQSRAAEFVKSHQPTADAVLADPQSNISVRTLGGSDSTCWLIIDAEGRLAYRGPAELSKLETALQAL